MGIIAMTNLLGLPHTFGSLSGGFGVVGLSFAIFGPCTNSIIGRQSRSEQIDSSSEGNCGFSANTLRNASLLPADRLID